jgi:pre-mRNA-splicing factor 38B
MSRSALWRQEGNVKEREREAEEAFAEALEGGRQRKSSSTLPLWGAGDNDDTFHWHPVLLRNTIHSSYFIKCCRELQDWNAIIDEIYCEVKTMDTFCSSAVKPQPSSAFCLLLRLLTYRMTEHQVSLTLQHADSPYIRAIGFLYLRYVCPPERMLEYIEPYLLVDDEDGQEIKVDRLTIPLAKFIRLLFTHRDYFGGTPLPRLPVTVEAAVQAKVRAADRAADRAAQHYKNSDRMQRLTTVGSEVMALYGDDDIPTTWYRAIVDRVVHQDETANRPFLYPRFIVTFPDYGNTETVRLGELDELQNQRHGQKEQDEVGNNRRYDNNNSNNNSNHHHQGRMESSRGNHHHGPRQPQRGHSRHQNHDRPLPPHSALRGDPPPHRPVHAEARHEAPRRPAIEESRTTTTTAVSAPAAAAAAATISKKPAEKKRPQRTPAELAVIAEKRRKLAAKYG